MPRFPLFAPLVLAAVLAGCGGGSADVGPDLSPAAAALSGAAPLVEVFGDSTMVRIYPGQAGDAASYAADALGQPVLNSAVAGSSAKDASPARIASSRAQVVVMNWAINDPHESNPVQYRERLTEQAAGAIKAGLAVVLLESTPIVPGGPKSALRDDTKRQTFEAIKRDVASLTGAFYCQLPARSWTLDDKPDGIHEADAAARWKGEALAACITRAL